jgi:hypothetical protein
MVDQITIRLDEFALRQFDDSTYLGTQVPANKDEFMTHLKTLLKSDKSLKLVDGYAPFCKHIFVKNWVPGVLVGAAKITPENVHLLESGYKARTEKELAVLCRWFPKGKVPIPEATVLDLILYSKEQITKECQAMGNPIPTEDYDWGLISVKGQTEGTKNPFFGCLHPYIYIYMSTIFNPFPIVEVRFSRNEPLFLFFFPPSKLCCALEA